MNKIVAPVLALIAVVFVWLMLPNVGDSIHDFRFDSHSADYSVSTAAAVTNTTEILQYDLADNDTQYVTDISSDLATDNPIATSYTSASNALLIVGLTADTSRNLTVEYQSAALEDYKGADSMVKLGPLVLIVVGLLLFLAILYRVFKR